MESSATEDWVQAAAAIGALLIALISLGISILNSKNQQEWQEEQAEKDHKFQHQLLQEQLEWQENAERQRREFEEANRLPIADATIRTCVQNRETWEIRAVHSSLINRGKAPIHILMAFLHVYLPDTEKEVLKLKYDPGLHSTRALGEPLVSGAGMTVHWGLDIVKDRLEKKGWEGGEVQLVAHWLGQDESVWNSSVMRYDFSRKVSWHKPKPAS